jgi:hypothetical protein
VKEAFAEYYRPSEEDFRRLWSNALFALDASAILNLYSLSPPSCTEFLGALLQLSDRLWIPHQAGLEYHKNRVKVIDGCQGRYASLLEDLHKIGQNLGQAFPEQRHPYVENGQQHVADLKSKIDALVEEVKRARERVCTVSGGDDILDRLTDLLDGRVGDPYTTEQLKNLYAAGESRYALGIPPGFADAKQKAKPHCYGDFIVWRQITDHSTSRGKDVILVIDDRKEDWWQKHKDMTLGPRAELIREFRDVTGHMYYQYESHRFLEYARDYLKLKVSQTAIEEIRAVSRAEAVCARVRGSSGSADIPRYFMNAIRVTAMVDDCLRECIQRAANAADDLSAHLMAFFESGQTDDAADRCAHAAGTLSGCLKRLARFWTPRMEYGSDVSSFAYAVARCLNEASVSLKCLAEFFNGIDNNRLSGTDSGGLPLELLQADPLLPDVSYAVYSLGSMLQQVIDHGTGSTWTQDLPWKITIAAADVSKTCLQIVKAVQ